MKKAAFLVTMMIVMAVTSASAQRLSAGAGVFAFSEEEFDAGLSLNFSGDLVNLNGKNLYLTVESDYRRAKFNGREYYKGTGVGIGIRSIPYEYLDYAVTGGLTFNELPDAAGYNGDVMTVWDYENSTGFYVSVSSSLYLPVIRDSFYLFLRGITGYNGFKGDTSWETYNDETGDYLSGTSGYEINTFYYTVTAGMSVKL